MTDIPREPLDHEPDEPGWSLGADGLWYPPEAATGAEGAVPTEPIPAVPAAPARTEMMPTVSPTTTSGANAAGTPMWLKVAAVVVGILLLAGIAFAIGRATGGSDDAAGHDHDVERAQRLVHHHADADHAFDPAARDVRSDDGTGIDLAPVDGAGHHLSRDFLARHHPAPGDHDAHHLTDPREPGTTEQAFAMLAATADARIGPWRRQLRWALSPELRWALSPEHRSARTS